MSNAKLNASSIEIDSLLRATAYDGPVRPRSEVAIVFTMDGRPNYESAYICKADDRVLQRDGKCATVVYLPPGQHVLAVKYVSRIEHGEVAVPVHVQAGKLYQLNASSVRTRDTGVWRFMPMQDGAKLTFRNIAPSSPQAIPGSTRKCRTGRTDGQGPVQRRLGSPKPLAGVDGNGLRRPSLLSLGRRHVSHVTS